MKRLRAVGALVVALGVGGCGSGGQPTAQPPASSTSTTTSATPPTTNEATSDEPVVDDASCHVLFIDSNAVLLSRSWNRVTASRGEPDHEQWVKEFGDYVDDVIHDVKDEPTVQARAACGLIELADMNYEVAVLNASVLATGEDEAEDEYYKRVADAANEWVKKIGAADKVHAFSATYTG